MSKRKRNFSPVIRFFMVLLLGCAIGYADPALASDRFLRVGWTSEPDVLNPFTSYSTEGDQIVNLCYEKLLSYDTRLESQNCLAESVEYSGDKLEVTYRLRRGVKWHDGHDFTAGDVVYTYNVIKDNAMGEYASYLKFLKEIEAVDDHAVIMRWSKPQAYDVAHAIIILPEHIWGGMSVEDIEAFPNSGPVGTGPYVFEKWDEGSSVSLVRNENYWGEKAGPGGVIFSLYGNEDVLAQALKAGEADIITEVAPTVWDGLKNVDGVKAVSLDSFSFHMIGMNCGTGESSSGNPMLLDKTVRQAINWCANRAQIVEIALAGHGAPGGVLLPPAMGDWHYKLKEDEIIDNNIEKAKAILDAAGYKVGAGGVREKDGKKMSFRIYAIESTTVDVRAAQILRDSCAKAGIELIVSTMDENTMGGLIFDESSDFDLYVWGWDSNILDPGYLLSIPLTSQIGDSNDTYYSNAKYDELYERQAVETDPAKRGEIIHEMQRIYYNDCAYCILWNQDKLQAYRTDTFTGWVETPGGLIYNMTYDNYWKVRPLSR